MPIQAYSVSLALKAFDMVGTAVETIVCEVAVSVPRCQR